MEDAIKCKRLNIFIIFFFIFRSRTNEEISEIISNLSNSKSPGLDLNNEITPFLLHIFNNVILTVEYPNILKISKIVLIAKAINVHKEDMYRPIALLPIMDKILERLIYQQFTTYLGNNNL